MTTVYLIFLQGPDQQYISIVQEISPNNHAKASRGGIITEHDIWIKIYMQGVWTGPALRARTQDTLGMLGSVCKDSC